ncbi:glutamate receptor ionotropic, delta-2 isoform X2 [Ceratina calcarata]|uniref:Glutamate receptor ionotropic, delta-2 isoform X2 n=1 Tax=Ceratina calcarata TaxID=156304 RepID=A0AAJ7RWQ3_9HYME|nr:glutamate receptor ionotropic, delta-2 isoform X2 [Ceratina calcarata]
MLQQFQAKVDVAVAFLPVLPETRRYCMFSGPLDEAKLTAVMKRPRESASSAGLLAPFERTVWLLVLASLLFVGPVIYIFAVIRAKLWHDPTSEKFNLSSCLWFVYSSLLKQGTNIIATTDTTRMLFATWWIFIMILTSFYTANLTAFLTKPQFTLPINSLQDIVQKGYSWITYKGRMIDLLLSQGRQNDLSPLNISRKQGKGAFRNYQPSWNILESVDAHKLFLADQHYLQTLIFKDYENKTRHHSEHNSRCRYVIMPSGILLISRAFGFPHGSTIKEAINQALMRFVQMGLVQQIKEKDLPLAEICPVDLRSSERQLRNTDLHLTYLIVIGGYAIAAVTFLLESIFATVLRLVKRKREKARNDLILKDNPRHPLNTGTAIEVNYMNMLKRTSPVIYPGPGNVSMERKQIINGRSYNIVIDRDGDRRLIPIRTPSAFLFQYAA